MPVRNQKQWLILRSGIHKKAFVNIEFPLSKITLCSSQWDCLTHPCPGGTLFRRGCVMPYLKQSAVPRLDYHSFGISSHRISRREDEIEKMTIPNEDYGWTTSDNEHLKHERRIARGSFGEVHEVETSHQ